VDHHRRIDIRLGHHHTLDATIRPFSELDTVQTQTLPPQQLIRHQKTIHPIVLLDVLRQRTVQRQTNSLTQTFLHRTEKIAGPAVIRTSAVLGRTEARVTTKLAPVPAEFPVAQTTHHFNELDRTIFTPDNVAVRHSGILEVENVHHIDGLSLGCLLSVKHDLLLPQLAFFG